MPISNLCNSTNLKYEEVRGVGENVLDKTARKDYRVCARHGKLQGAQYLHARGADIFATDIHGNNAMYHALSGVPFAQNMMRHKMFTSKLTTFTMTLLY